MLSLLYYVFPQIFKNFMVLIKFCWMLVNNNHCVFLCVSGITMCACLMMNRVQKGNTEAKTEIYELMKERRQKKKREEVYLGPGTSVLMSIIKVRKVSNSL